MASSLPRATARLSVDVTPRQRQRLRLAATLADQSLRDYVWEAVSARIERDLAQNTAPRLALTGDPVLEELWNNPHDAIYDHPVPR